jgi:hypothetical protein
MTVPRIWLWPSATVFVSSIVINLQPNFVPVKRFMQTLNQDNLAAEP